MRLASALPVLLALAAVLLAPDALAAAIPYGDAPLTITAREQPIQSFLQDLFGRLDLPVDVSANVKGQVSGSFSGPPRTVVRDISRSFGLLTYFDGVVVHVYSAGEIASRALAVSPAVAARALRSVEDAGLTDARNTLRMTPDGGLLSIGAPRFVDQVDDFVRAAQVANAAQPPLGFKVFYLRYAWAQDVSVNFGGHEVTVPGVATILRSLVSTGTRSQVPEQLPRSTVPKLRGTGLARYAAQTPDRYGTLGAPGAAVPPANGGDAVAQGLAAAYGGVQLPPDPNAPPPAQADSNPVRIEVDQRLNAVIVRDVPERMPQYEQLVAALDVEPQSLEIEATIIDLDTSKLAQLGINWRWSNNGRNSVMFGRGDSSDLNLRPDTDITPTGKGGFVSAVLDDAGRFVARINALQSDGAARVVSSPRVVTLSNVEAIFDNSQTFYVRVNGFQDVDLFNVTAGTNLRVTPHVFKDDGQVRIKLLVNIEDGSLTSQTVDNLPVVERSAVNTQALIQEGESLLIGGLVRQSSNSAVDKIPFLGDIPLLGNLFKNRSDNNDRIERMFLISPRLAPHSRVADAAIDAAHGPAPTAETPSWPLFPPPNPQREIVPENVR